MTRGVGPRWIAVAGAIVLGVLVVAGLLASRPALRGAPAHPAPSPTAAATGLGGVGWNLPPGFADLPPPAGVPLFYLQDQQDPSTGWYIGIDWTGKPRGRIKVAIDHSESLFQAPDGSGFAMDFGSVSGFQQFLDRLGQPVGTDPTPYQSQMWADDSRHLCILEKDSGQWKVGLRAPAVAPTSLHPVALDSSNLRSGITVIHFSRCSAVNDRAILTEGYVGHPAEVWVVRISDGTILSYRVDQPNAFSEIVASGDGVLIADNSGQSLGYDAGPTPPTTIIERAADGSVVTTLDPSMGVLAFSGDNAVVLVTTSPAVAGFGTHLALVRVADGSVVWRYDGNEQYSANFIEPNGSAIAVMLQSTDDAQSHGSVDVVILNPDGTSTPLPVRFGRPF